MKYTYYDPKYRRNILNAILLKGCHASESWHPKFKKKWIPAFAGMTTHSSKMTITRKKSFSHWVQLRLGLVLLASVLLSACASGPLKAPCDQYATFCGTKTKINQW